MELTTWLLGHIHGATPCKQETDPSRFMPPLPHMCYVLLSVSAVVKRSPALLFIYGIPRLLSRWRQQCIAAIHDRFRRPLCIIIQFAWRVLYQVWRHGAVCAGPFCARKLFSLMPIRDGRWICSLR